MWQDTVLIIINFGFILTIIPAIFRNYKFKDVKGQSFLTYSTTPLLLTVMCGIFFSLNLPLSAVGTGGTAITWYILLGQKIYYTKRE